MFVTLGLPNSHVSFSLFYLGKKYNKKHRRKTNKKENGTSRHSCFVQARFILLSVYASLKWSGVQTLNPMIHSSCACKPMNQTLKSSVHAWGVRCQKRSCKCISQTKLAQILARISFFFQTLIFLTSTRLVVFRPDSPEIYIRKDQRYLIESCKWISWTKSPNKLYHIALTFRRFTVFRPGGRPLLSCFSDMSVTSNILSCNTSFWNIKATCNM